MIRKVRIKLGDATQSTAMKFRDEVEKALEEILLKNGLEAEGELIIWLAK